MVFSCVGQMEVTSHRVSLRRVDPGHASINESTEEWEERSNYRWTSAAWIRSLGFKSIVHIDFCQSSYAGFKSTITTYNLVNCYTHPIFEACRAGDIPAVQSLLSAKPTSVNDVSPDGFTPLHFAVTKSNPTLYNLIIQNGAEKTLQTVRPCYRRRVSEGTVGLWKSSIVKLDDFISTLNAFRKLIDFDIDGTGWTIFEKFSFDRGPHNDRGAKDIEILMWLLRNMNDKIGENFSSQCCKEILLQFMRWPEAFDRFLHDGPIKNIDAAGPLQEYTILQHCIALGFDCSNILKHGPNLHIVRSDPRFTKRPGTATSLAMYSAREFFIWRRALEAQEVDLEQFIDEELDTGPLAVAGWSERTFHQLFRYEISSSILHDRLDDYLQRYIRCADCQRFRDFHVQPYWLHLLDLIRSGVPLCELPVKSAPTDAEFRALREDAIERHHEQLLMFNDLDTLWLHYLPKPNRRIAKQLNDTNPLYGWKWPFTKRTLICRDCWYYYEETTTHYEAPKWPYIRERVQELKPCDEVQDGDDDDGFSPFLIHPISASSEAETEIGRRRRMEILDVTKVDVQQRMKMQLRAMQRGWIEPLDIHFAELEEYLVESGILGKKSAV